MKFLFLYTELADYFLKCCEELTKEGEVHIVRWPVNNEAPFKFAYPEKIKVYDKNNYKLSELKSLIAGIKPDLIVCSGWIDKDYLSLTKTYFKKIPTVLTCDTHWTGSLKQRLATVLSRLFLLNTFSHAWVPGNIQATYAKKLGFKSDVIHQGFYCCDLNKFNSLFQQFKGEKEKDFPKRFLYVGRYYYFKGVVDLWDAFIELQNEMPNEWELWCLGTGNITPIHHPKIKHFGFVQPKELNPILEKCGVFVLPSRFEPWGVVVQEYAAAGFPLILSDTVGASETFLGADNGLFFKAGDKQEIKAQLKKVINFNQSQLKQKALASHQIAQKITPQQWVHTVLKIYNDFRKS